MNEVTLDTVVVGPNDYGDGGSDSTDRGSTSTTSRGSNSSSGGNVPGSDASEDSTADTSSSKPILLDLDGDGIEVTELPNSNQYFDLAGDGSKHLTAWAGAGDGILVRDAGNDGRIDLAHEIDFTYWDSSATSDMEALRNAFDTNRNGKLDAGDRDFFLFKVMVTNNNGTTSLKTLTELGITSIGLVTDNQAIRLQDGSAIQGSTTFTKTNGTTGTAADVVLAYASDGHNVKQTVSTKADGSTTVVNTAYDEDGGIAEVVTATVSANGLTRTVSTDGDGDGVRDILVNETTTVASGETTLTRSTYDGSGTILSSREVTKTSADKKVVTINRDADGSGAFDSTEIRTKGADGSLTLQIKGLNPDGTTRADSTTTTSANGLSQTIRVDLDGDGGANATRTVATTVAANATRTETLTEYAGTGTAAANKIGQEVTTYRGDGTGRRTVSDLDGDGDTDRIVDDVIERKADGSTVTTSTTTNGDASLRSRTITTLSADGNTQTVDRDADGDGIYELKTRQVTTVDANGVVNRTVTSTTANGARTNQGVSTWNADGSARSTQVDTDGDGLVDKISRIEIVNGQPVERIFSYSPDGSVLLTGDVRTTSGNGLTSRSVGDANGDGVSDSLIDGTIAATTGGGATRTNVIRAGDETEVARIVTNASADGLSATVEQYRTGASSAEFTMTGTLARNSDGSTIQTMTALEGTNKVQTGRTTVSTSADKLSEIQSRFVNNNTQAEETVTTQTSANGEVNRTTKLFSPDGSTLLSSEKTTSSANGLQTKTTFDVDGNGVTDATISSDTKLNADGTVTSTATSYAGSVNATGQKTGELSVRTSANGLSVTTLLDKNGDGAFDEKRTKVTVLETDGSKTTTEITSNGDGSVQTGKVVTKVSDDGLLRSVTTYLGNLTTADSIVRDTFKINADGLKTTTSETFNANETLRSSVTTTTSMNGLVTTTKTDLDGDRVVDETVVRTTKADGSRTSMSETFNAAGTLTSRSMQTTDSSGRTVTTETDLDGGGTIDRRTRSETVVNTNGTRVVTGTEYDGANVMKGRSVVTTSADGSNVGTQLDGAGSGSFSRTYTNARVVEADGSVRETLPGLYAAAPLGGNVKRVTSADGKTSTTTADRDGNGVADQTIVQAQKANGSLTSSYMAGEVKSASGRLYGAESGRYETVSSNGLVATVRYDDDGNGLAERQVVQTTTLATNGSRTTETVRSNLSGGSATAADPTYTVSTTAKASSTASADGLTVTTTWDMNGDGTTDRNGSVQTTLGTDASTSTTRSLFEAGALSGRTTVTTSGDGLTITTKQDADGSGSFEGVLSETSARMTNGSVADTATLRDENGALISKILSTTSADGRTRTINKDLDGSGQYEETVSITRKAMADGAATETRTRTDASGAQLSRVVTDTSADRRETTITRDSDGNGSTDQRQVTTVRADGSSSSRITDYGAGGTTASVRTVATSWDGLVRTEDRDFDANGTIDEVEKTEIVRNADGSGKVTVSTTKSGVLDEQVRTTTRADGQVKVETDVDGNGSFDKTSVTVVNIDGSTTTTASANAAARSDKQDPGLIAWSSEVASDRGTIAVASVTDVRSDGSVTTVRADYDGNGTHEHVRTSTTRLDGSIVTKIVEKASSGSVVATGTILVGADGRKTVLTKDVGANGTIDERQELVVLDDGQRKKTTTVYAADGSVSSTLVEDVYANGELRSSIGTGSGGHDTMRGTSGNDRLSGLAGNDTILGLDGDDTLVGGSGADVLNGGAGKDVVSYEASGSGITVRLWTTGEGGDAAGDTFVDVEGVVGSAYADLISGQDHIGESIWGGLGNDTLSGFGSADTIEGGAGDDSIDGGNDADKMTGGVGNDTINGAAGSDTYVYAAGDGTDTIIDGTGSADTDKLVFGAGILPADVVVTRSSTDSKDAVITFSNRAGSVVIDEQFSTVSGSLGIEQIVFANGTVWDRAAIAAAVGSGGTGGSTINGTSGNDTLTGTSAAEAINGLAGNDVLKGLAGADTLDGGAGIDTADYSDKTTAVVATLNGSTNATVTVGGAAEDVIRNIENLVGGSGGDNLTGDGLANTLTGGAGNDSLTGGAGDDLLVGGAGADTIDGGAGIDTVSFAGSSTKVDVYLWDDGIGGDAQGDRYINVEAAIGSAFNDRIYGQDHIGETMKGGLGNDELYGNGGNDVLEGEAGNDWLDGGTGNDTFAFRSGFGKDSVDNFVAGAGSDDVVQFDSAVFANYAAVRAAATQVGADTLITLDANNTLTLKNVALSSLHSDDFRFV